MPPQTQLRHITGREALPTSFHPAGASIQLISLFPATLCLFINSQRTKNKCEKLQFDWFSLAAGKQHGLPCVTPPPPQQQQQQERKPCISSSEKRNRKQSLTFGFFIWNDRSKSSVCESLFYFTSTGRKGVVIILCAHVQCLSQWYPSRGEKKKKPREEEEEEQEGEQRQKT